MKGLITAIFIGVLVPTVWLAPAALVHWQLSGHIEFWHDLYRFEKGRYQYYFEGANKRGLLDICQDETARPAVRFKEDCK